MQLVVLLDFSEIIQFDNVQLLAQQNNMLISQPNYAQLVPKHVLLVPI